MVPITQNLFEMLAITISTPYHMPSNVQNKNINIPRERVGEQEKKQKTKIKQTKNINIPERK